MSENSKPSLSELLAGIDLDRRQLAAIADVLQALRTASDALERAEFDECRVWTTLTERLAAEPPSDG